MVLVEPDVNSRRGAFQRFVEKAVRFLAGAHASYHVLQTALLRRLEESVASGVLSAYGDCRGAALFVHVVRTLQNFTLLDFRYFYRHNISSCFF
jgi:hypothetical protein